MRVFVRTVAVCVWVGFAPAALQVAEAGQLPDDVHPVSRSRLPPIDREELDPARREAYDAAMRADGSAGVPTGAPALRLHGSGTDLRFSGPLGRRLTELAILTTARELDQPYEWALHELDALAVGLDELLIDIVRHRKPITSVGDPEAIVMEVGRELLTTRRLDSDTYARALARLGKTNLVDLVDLIGRYTSVAATLTAFNQQMPLGWRQSLPLPFTYPDDIHADSRSRLPLRPGPYRASVTALYGRLASPGGLGPGQIRAYGEGLETLEARVGELLMMLAILVTARAHDSQYDWTMNEPKALEAGLEPEVIDVIRHRGPAEGLDEQDAALVTFARELFGDHNVGAETYERAATLFGERDLVDIVRLMGAHAADAVVLAAFDQQLPEGVEPLLPGRTAIRTTGYHNIHIAATDPQAAIAWYMKHLGAVDAGTGATAVKFGDTFVVFRKTDAPKRSVGSVIDHYGISVPDIEAAVKKLEGSGTTILEPVHEAPGLFKRAFFEDPLGAKVELVQDAEWPKFHHVHLMVEDPNETLAWYEEVMGGTRDKLKGKIDGLRYDGVWLLAGGSGGKRLVPSAERSIQNVGWEHRRYGRSRCRIQRSGRENAGRTPHGQP